MPVAVLFFEAPRTPLVAGASAGIEAAAEICRRIGPGNGKLPTVRAGELGPSCGIGLVCELGPAALGADIPGTRHPRLVPREHLRVRLSATERYGKRNSGAQHTAICHPQPPATNTRVTMVAP